MGCGWCVGVQNRSESSFERVGGSGGRWEWLSGAPEDDARPIQSWSYQYVPCTYLAASKNGSSGVFAVAIVDVEGSNMVMVIKMEMEIDGTDRQSRAMDIGMYIGISEILALLVVDGGERQS